MDQVEGDRGGQGTDYRRGPFCEPCWERGFASPSRVVAGGRSRCIACHIDYEIAQEQAREDREREQTAWTQTR